MTDWNFARVWDGVAAVAPEREAVVCGPVRRSFRELHDRACRLASFFASSGLEPGDKVAIDLLNRPEYLEVFYAALELGCVPVNVNYRYGVEETAYLLDDSDARIVVHEFPDTVGAAVARLPEPVRPETLAVGDAYEDALATAEPLTETRRPEGDDLVFLYTGGTTGLPKGVMWRNDDLYTALWQMGRPGTEPPDPIAAVATGKQAGTCLPACPLMHGTGLFIALSTLSGGGTVVLIDAMSLDPAEVWSEAQRNEVRVLTIVGDVFARPLLAALDTQPDRWDLGTLRAITSSGVTWSPETKRGLLDHLPHVTLLDSLGASEGIMSRSAARAGDATIAPGRFALGDRVRVLREDDGRDVVPGTGEVGLVAVGGPIPAGYYKDPEKSAQTFRVIDGSRFSVPGDYASVDTDGSIRLLGRGSACINTGGEKVYPEEVELVLRRHDAVFDCIVVGVPDHKFGEAVVALVQPRDGSSATADELRRFCRHHTAGYKTPKCILFVESLDRAPNGKADYRVLRAKAAELLESRPSH